MFRSARACRWCPRTFAPRRLFRRVRDWRWEVERVAPTLKTQQKTRTKEDASAPSLLLIHRIRPRYPRFLLHLLRDVIQSAHDSIGFFAGRIRSENQPPAAVLRGDF